MITPVGMQITQAHVGADERLDSDIDNSNGEGTTAMMSISPGTHIPFIDVGVLESVLPVEWISIEGERKQNKNIITWTVANEINVSHYEIERSVTDEFEFERIGEKVYFDNGETENVYSYDDFNVQGNQVYYYRVKQVDLNGDYSYSRIVSIQSEDFTFENVVIKMYPNPAYDRVVLSFDHFTVIEEAELLFITSIGEVVKKEVLTNVIISPDKPLSFNISDLPEGVYSWLLSVDDFTTVDRLVIVDKP